MRTKIESEELMFASQFVYESNLIENINIPFEEIWRGWTRNPLKGHLAALALATIDANQKKLLTEQMICEWQKLIIQEQNSWVLIPEKIIPESEVGQYRSGGLMLVAGKRCMPSEVVPVCMKNFVEEMGWFIKNSWDSKREVIGKIADFHFDFLWIHPFVDGNGRTSRILAWYLFNYFGIKPFIFTNADKHQTYYKAFDGMREYFIKKSAL